MFTNKHRSNLSWMGMLSFLSFCCVTFLISSSFAAEKPIKWKCQASIAAASSSYTKSVLKVAEEIKERTNGGLTIECFSSGAIVPNKEIFPAVKRGIFEMGYSVPGYWKTDIPLSQVCGLPGAFVSYWEVIYFYRMLGFEKMLSDQIATHGVKYWSDRALPTQIVSKKPIKTYEDFKGLKIRTYGNLAKYMGLCGAVTVYVPGPEIYTSLATGVFDAATWGAAVGANGLGLYDVGKFHILPSIAMGTDEGWFINEKAFNKLPENYQKIVDDVLRDHFIPYTIDYAYQEAELLGKLQKEQGVKLITLPDETVKQMTQQATTIWDQVASEYPGNEKAISMLKDFLKAVGRL